MSTEQDEMSELRQEAIKCHDAFGREYFSDSFIHGYVKGVMAERARKDEWKEEAGRLLERARLVISKIHPQWHWNCDELLSDMEKLCPRK